MLLMHAAILNQQGQAGGGRSITYSVNRTSYSTVQVQPQPTREFASIAAVWVDHTLLRASSIASARVAATSQGCKNPLPKKALLTLASTMTQTDHYRVFSQQILHDLGPYITLQPSDPEGKSQP